MARIETPLLDTIQIAFLHQLIIDIPQLALFMRQATRLQAPNEARVDFYYYGIQVEFLPLTRAFGEKSGLRISCNELDKQLPSLAQVFTSVFPSTYMAEHLYICGHRRLPSQWQGDIENLLWLEILSPFTAARNVYVFKAFSQCISSALQDLVGERMTDVLPALESLFLEGFQPSGPVQEAIGQFVAARQLLGHPVAISPLNETGQ